MCGRKVAGILNRVLSTGRLGKGSVIEVQWDEFDGFNAPLGKIE